MKWEQDLNKDIRTFTNYDDKDLDAILHIPAVVAYLNSGSKYEEFSRLNSSILQSKFLSIKDRCKAVLEIGVNRPNVHTNSPPSTDIFIKNKKKETVYVGIDIEDRSFVDEPQNNVHTIMHNSSDYAGALEKIKKLGVEKFDFIFIDGLHDINQFLDDWEYTNLLAEEGIIGLHDTNYHPGPVRFLNEIKKDIWHVESYCPEDWGISFLHKRKINTNNTRKNYDFLEIGTSDFDALIEKADEFTHGLSVEPHKTYLERLPSKRNVHKVNVALVTEEQYAKSQSIDFYYVHEDIINKYNLGWWLKGCNSVGRPHDFHLAWFPEPWVWHQLTPEERATRQTFNLIERGLVTIEKVPCKTFKMLAEEYDIGQINLLKVDVEGQDPPLVRSIVNYYVNNNLSHLLPKEIFFESNTHSDEKECQELRDYLATIGYDVFIVPENTRAIRK